MSGTRAAIEGIGGWLLLLCIWLTFGSGILFLMLSAVLWLRGAWATEGLTETALLLGLLGVLCLPGFVVGLMLWLGARGAFTMAVIFVALNAFMLAVSILAVVENHEFSGKMSDLVVAIDVALLVINLAWLLYLLTSVRVRNTYRKPYAEAVC
jgi:hypothetical protein